MLIPRHLLATTGISRQENRAGWSNQQIISLFIRIFHFSAY
ncbi:hypothetical protein DLM_3827 [Aquitalea magnusonii]|uniref:Uncharacterized protein n=1 Tax=Aquitalea magnusonii TaxID=332411 RepID=A0A3G9GTB1_9NEIS|nr:hypothetical protein DLM_3827 [Aquitalea magnusonii]